MMAAAALVAARLLPRTHPAERTGNSGSPGFRAVPAHMWVLAIAYVPLTMVMFQAFSGLAQIFDDGETAP